MATSAWWVGKARAAIFLAFAIVWLGRPGYALADAPADPTGSYARAQATGTWVALAVCAFVVLLVAAAALLLLRRIADRVRREESAVVLAETGPGRDDT